MRRRKTTPEQRHQLLQVYLHMGRQAARTLCVEYGVDENYAAKLATENSLRQNPGYRGGGNISFDVDHTDRRWAWAIERGAVFA